MSVFITVKELRSRLKETVPVATLRGRRPGSASRGYRARATSSTSKMSAQLGRGLPYLSKLPSSSKIFQPLEGMVSLFRDRRSSFTRSPNVSILASGNIRVKVSETESSIGLLACYLVPVVVIQRYDSLIIVNKQTVVGMVRYCRGGVWTPWTSPLSASVSSSWT